jgi:galactokinase/mevalonate kinase-like predicted kinase
VPGAFFSSAPGRAGIIGNPTDLYGGAVISCSTQERSAVIIEPAEEMVFEMADRRLVVKGPEDLVPDGGVFDVAKAVVCYLDVRAERFRLRWTCNVPFRAGLSSSSAMTVGILNAVLAFLGRDEHPFRRAEMARQGELHYLGILCGYQDAYMCTFGGLNYMDFSEKQFYRAFGQEPYATIEPLTAYIGEIPLVLGHTGVQRNSGSVHKPIRERWIEGDREVVQSYLRIAHLARQGKRALLDRDLEALGELMIENHEIQRDLGGSGPQNDRLIEAALEAGALGAKLAGAGAGGTVIALATDARKVVDAFRAAGATRILFPKPMPGVTVKPLHTREARAEAEREFAQRAEDADVRQ